MGNMNSEGERDVFKASWDRFKTKIQPTVQAASTISEEEEALPTDAKEALRPTDPQMRTGDW